MKLISPELKSESTQEPDIIPEHLEQLKSWVKEQIVAAGASGVDIVDLMRSRREDKSGERFWQCFTDSMWITVGKEIEQEFATAKSNANNVVIIEVD